MVNSIGIIDKGYTGTIKVPLLKISNQALPIKLPYTGFQIIFKPNIHSSINCISYEEIVSTERSSNGFGSTNK